MTGRLSLTEVAAELQQVIGPNRQQRTPENNAKLQRVFDVRIIPFLRPAIERGGLNEGDTGVLMKLVAILRSRLSRIQLTQLLFTLIPLFPAIRFESCREKASLLCIGLAQDLALQGKAMLLFKTFDTILASLAEGVLSGYPFQVSIGAVAEEVEASVFSVTSAGTVDKFLPTLLRSVAVLSPHVFSCWLHDSTLRKAVFFCRVAAGSPEVRIACLGLIKTLVSRTGGELMLDGPANGSRTHPLANAAFLCLHALCMRRQVPAEFYLLRVEKPVEDAPLLFPAEELDIAQDVLRACLAQDDWIDVALPGTVEVLVQAVRHTVPDLCDQHPIRDSYSTVLLDVFTRFAAKGKIRLELQGSNDMVRNVVAIYYITYYCNMAETVRRQCLHIIVSALTNIRMAVRDVMAHQDIFATAGELLNSAEPPAKKRRLQEAENIRGNNKDDYAGFGVLLAMLHGDTHTDSLDTTVPTKNANALDSVALLYSLRRYFGDQCPVRCALSSAILIEVEKTRTDATEGDTEENLDLSAWLSAVYPKLLTALTKQCKVEAKQGVSKRRPWNFDTTVAVCHTLVEMCDYETRTGAVIASPSTRSTDLPGAACCRLTTYAIEFYIYIVHHKQHSSYPKDEVVRQIRSLLDDMTSGVQRRCIATSDVLLAYEAGLNERHCLTDVFLEGLIGFLKVACVNAGQREQIAEWVRRLVVIEADGAAFRSLALVLKGLYTFYESTESQGSTANQLCLSGASAPDTTPTPARSTPYYNSFLNGTTQRTPFFTTRKAHPKRDPQEDSPSFFDMTYWLPVLEANGSFREGTPEYLAFFNVLVELSGDELGADAPRAILTKMFDVKSDPRRTSLGLLMHQNEQVRAEAETVMFTLVKRDGQDADRIREHEEEHAGPTLGMVHNFFLTVLQRLFLGDRQAAQLTALMSSATQRWKMGEPLPPMSMQGVVGGKSGIHLLFEHFDFVRRKQNRELDESLTLLLCGMARAMDTADTGLCVVVETLLSVLVPDVQSQEASQNKPQNRPQNCAISFILARQELKHIEQRSRSSLVTLLSKSSIFDQLIAELQCCIASSNFSSETAPLFTVVADYVDCDIEGFVLDHLPVLVSHILQHAGESSGVKNMLSVLVRSVTSLDPSRLSAAGLSLVVFNEAALDVPGMITEVLLVSVEPLLTAVFLKSETVAERQGGYDTSVASVCDTLCEGPMWADYFTTVVAQLHLLNENARNMVVSAIPPKSAFIAHTIIQNTGRQRSKMQWRLAVQRARRALIMLAICHNAAREHSEGRALTPYPVSATALTFEERSDLAKERVGDAFFHILDSVCERLTGSTVSIDQKDRTKRVHTADQNVTIITSRDALDMLFQGLRVVRGLIMLLGVHISKFANKLTPTLNFHFLRLNTRFIDSTSRRLLGMHLGDTWIEYFSVLAEDALVDNLDAFIVEALCLRVVSEAHSIKIVSLLFARTKMHKKKWISVVHFLPFSSKSFAPLIEQITTHLNVQDRHAQNSREGFLERLKEIHQGLCSNSKECRNLSLGNFTEYCESNWALLHECLSVKEVPEVIWKMVQTLLKMSRDWDADTEMHSKVLKSIGLVGAVDPIKMKCVRSSCDTSLEDLDDESFCIRLINDYLLQTLQIPYSAGGKTQAHDKAAYAIQELFKFLKEKTASRMPLSTTKGKTPGIHEQWWSRIKEEGKAKLAPYLDTKYHVVVTQARDAKTLEFSAGMSFRQWLRAWMLNLISKTQGPRGTIVQSVRNVVKDNIDMALFILPYLVLNVCVHGGEDIAALLAREINTVLVYADEHPGNASEHVQVVCSLLDKLSAWRNEVTTRRTSKKSIDPAKYSAEEGKARHIGTLLEKVPYLLLAKACRVTNPARALFYTEFHLRSVKETKGAVKRHALTQLSQVGGSGSWCASRDLRLLQEVYSRLREPDGLLGVQSLRQQNQFHEDMEEQALDCETMGLWSDAMQRYELLIEWSPNSTLYQERMMECMKSLGQYSVMIAYAETRPHLRPFAVQAAWRLSDWELTEKALAEDASMQMTDTTTPPAVDFETGIAKALLAMRRNDLAAVQSITEATRDSLHSELAAACLESYDTAYKHVVKLHALTDIERAIEVARTPATESSASTTRKRDRFLRSLADHTELTELTPETRDILLSVRRSLSSIFSVHKEAGRTWLEIGRLCRNARLFQVAEGALLRAEGHHTEIECRPEGLIIQQAKLLYAQGNIHAALRLVSNMDTKLEEYETDASATRAKMRLKSVNWATEINHLPESEVIKEYKEIAEQKPTEAAFLSLAKFLEKMLQDKKEQIEIQKRHIASLIPTKQPAARSSALREAAAAIVKTITHACDNQVSLIEETVLHIKDTLRTYAKAVQRGHKHLYHALPRLIGTYIMSVSELTASLEYVRSVYPSTGAISPEAIVQPLHEVMKEVLPDVSTEVLYTSLNTLVPLLTHNSPIVVSILGFQIRRVVKHFPDRAAWALMCFVFSTRAERQAVMQNEVIKVLEIESRESSTARAAMEVIQQCRKATDAINKLAAHKAKDREVHFHELPFYKSLGASLPLRLVVPIQAQLTLTLPNSADYAVSASTLFPATERIHSVENKALVMSSLQAPKKATFMSTRGIPRAFLCKANDELRKDHRIMELCHIMNLLLKKNPDTRKRDLNVRTFCVTLTGDTSGMIEWVNNVMPFRNILDDQYLRSALGIQTKTIKVIVEKKEKKRITYMDAYKQISSKFPPVLHIWLANQFPDPTTWFRARSSFTKSCSVWSMIGHIVGLGDRHAENILLDVSTGDIVHVDFAVLFDKGLALAYEEVVRFRLTPNLVDGFGVSGVEGVFRSCCELSMDVMRKNKETVMSVMEQFVHDPCLEKSDGVELVNIGRRLDGYFDDPLEIVRKKTKKLTGGVQLGVKGQVQKLITNTTSAENFSRMYHWWMPWY